MTTTPPENDLDVIGREFARHLARTDPTSREIRSALAGFESRAHRLGWDGYFLRPRLFEVVRPQRGLAAIREARVLSATLHTIIERNPRAEVGQCAVRLAELMETGRRVAADDPALDRYLADLDQHTLGYGVGTEAWGAEGYGGPPPEERPDRREERLVMFAGRDGIVWVVRRRRGENPTVTAHGPESDNAWGGHIVHALGRMTASAASNPVPVPPIYPHGADPQRKEKP